MFSQILLVTTITPDFNAEEECSIQKDFMDLRDLIGQIEGIVPEEHLIEDGWYFFFLSTEGLEG